MEILGLLACVSVLAGCGEKGDAAKRAERARTDPHNRSAEDVARLAAQRLTQDVVAATPLYRVRVLAPDSAEGSGWSAAMAPQSVVEDFRARMVQVDVSPEAEKLSALQRAQARAHAFGLEWRVRHYLEMEQMLHCKSAVRGCSNSYGTIHLPDAVDATFTQTASGYLDGDEKTPYSLSQEYLGSRDGKDHYLAVFEVEETTSGALGATAGEANASSSAEIAAEIFAQHDLPAGAWASRTFTDPHNASVRLKVTVFSGGAFEVTSTRSVSYEVVYGGEPFYLKLADRVLLCVGGQGIERYTAEERAAMARGQTGMYRSCPNCALSDDMTVDELRLLAHASS